MIAWTYTLCKIGTHWSIQTSFLILCIQILMPMKNVWVTVLYFMFDLEFACLLGCFTISTYLVLLPLQSALFTMCTTLCSTSIQSLSCTVVDPLIAYILNNSWSLPIVWLVVWRYTTVTTATARLLRVKVRTTKCCTNNLICSFSAREVFSTNEEGKQGGTVRATTTVIEIYKIG